jgi:hypothetical protein
MAIYDVRSTGIPTLPQPRGTSFRHGVKSFSAADPQRPVFRGRGLITPQSRKRTTTERAFAALALIGADIEDVTELLAAQIEGVNVVYVSFLRNADAAVLDDIRSGRKSLAELVAKRARASATAKRIDDLIATVGIDAVFDKLVHASKRNGGNGNGRDID